MANDREFLIKEALFDTQSISHGNTDKGLRWRRRDCDHEWAATPANRTAKTGSNCPECAVRRRTAALRKPKPGQSLADLRPDIASEAWGWDPREFKVRSNDVKLWKCPNCDLVYPAIVNNRTRLNSACKRCASKQHGLRSRKPRPGFSVADQYPQIAAEAHGWDPSAVAYKSNEKVEWKCAVCSHVWEEMVASRTDKGAGCEDCREGGG